MTGDLWHDSSDESLVIRTDFSNQRDWLDVKAAIVDPRTDHQFRARVRFVDDEKFDGLAVSRLLELVPPDTDHTFVFLVDAVALAHADQPVLVVNLFDPSEVGATFRVVPSVMWSVENNLSTGNMDWEDFALNLDPERIFRGFGTR